MPGIPPFLWFDSVFRAIGNHLGRFLEVGMSFLQTRDKGITRIVVSLNPQEGLAEEINLKYKDFTYTHMLDYEHLPFRCHQCHKYGHLARECSSGFRRRRRQRKEGVGKGPNGEMNRNKGTPGFGEDQMEVDKMQEDTVDKMEVQE